MARAQGQEPRPTPAAKHPPGNRRRFKPRAPACRGGCRESQRDYISRQAPPPRQSRDCRRLWGAGPAGRCSPWARAGLLLPGKGGRGGRPCCVSAAWSGRKRRTREGPPDAPAAVGQDNLGAGGTRRCGWRPRRVRPSVGATGIQGEVNGFLEMTVILFTLLDFICF